MWWIKWSITYFKNTFVHNPTYSLDIGMPTNPLLFTAILEKKKLTTLRLRLQNKTKKEFNSTPNFDTTANVVLFSFYLFFNKLMHLTTSPKAFISIFCIFYKTVYNSRWNNALEKKIQREQHITSKWMFLFIYFFFRNNKNKGLKFKNGKNTKKNKKTKWNGTRLRVATSRPTYYYYYIFTEWEKKATKTK